MTVHIARNSHDPHPLGLRFWLALCLSLPLGLCCFAQNTGFPDKNSAEWQVYTNDALFNMLSGAAQTRAELHFGKRPLSKAESNGIESSGWFPATDQVITRDLIKVRLVNNPVEDTTSQDTQSETSLAIAGTNVVCGFNDSALYGGSATKFTGWSTSADNGMTWVDGLSLPTNPDGDGGDPTLAYSTKTGTLLFGTLSLNINTPQDLPIFRSADNGVTFTGPVQGAPGYSSSTGNMDKEWLTCDNFVGVPGSGYGNFYLFWRNFGSPGGITLTISTNDGVSFGPAPGIVLDTALNDQGANVIVGPDHSVYCFWFNNTTLPARIVMRKSTDHGQTFGPIIAVTSLNTTGVNGDLALGGYRSNTFPQTGINPVTGAIYIVYPDILGADHGNIYFRQSTDGGNTWSAPITVNDDGTTRAQFQPGIACRPDGTGLAVSWYDRRSDPADTLIERWAATATIVSNVVTFNPNFRLSPQFPAVFGVDTAVYSTYMGDYDQMVADNNYYYTSWGDNRDQSIAVPARKNANVRFAHFGQNDHLLAPSLALSSVALQGGNGNGLVDANECNNLMIVLRNDGGFTATNVSVTLSASAPGLTLTQPTAAFPDIPVGAMGTNLTSFALSTSPCFVCGTPININATFNYIGGSDPGAFTLPVSNTGYSVNSSSGASIIPGVADSGNHADDGVTSIALPFPYTFYGTSYTNAWLSSNGNIQFSGSPNSAYLNACPLPAAGFGDAIFVFWDDLMTSMPAGAGIFLSTNGVAPNRIFNLEWRASYYPGSTSLNFEARLYEGQQRLDIIYGNLNGTGSSATVGLQHGTVFTSYECNAGGLSLGQQLTFLSTPCPTGNGQCPAQAPMIPAPSISGNNFSFSFATEGCRTYNVQYKNNLDDPSWQLAQSFVGDGSSKTFTTPLSTAYQFYRLQVQ